MTSLAANYPFFFEDEGVSYDERDLPVLEKIEREGLPSLFEVEVDYHQNTPLEKEIDFPFAEELEQVITHYVLYLCQDIQQLHEFLLRNELEAKRIRRVPFEDLKKHVRRAVLQSLKWRSAQHVTQVCVLNKPAQEGSEERKSLKMRA